MELKDSSANVTINKILKINEAILDHLSICQKECHLKGVLMEIFLENENSQRGWNALDESPTTAPSDISGLNSGKKITRYG
jgi:hypothetical protein